MPYFVNHFCYSSQSRRLKQSSGSLLEDLSKFQET